MYVFVYLYLQAPSCLFMWEFILYISLLFLLLLLLHIYDIYLFVFDLSCFSMYFHFLRGFTCLEDQAELFIPIIPQGKNLAVLV